jgi:phage terminase large subunit-like protein
MLTEYFAGKRSSLIIIPKKNGKTTLLAALGLYHLLSTPEAECVIAAASREQAGIMLRQVRGFIHRSDRLRQRLRVTQRVISYPKLDGQIRILASDVDTMDGVIPSLALIDELHRHKRPDVYGVLRDGLGPRDGRLITISTAGDDLDSPLGQLRAAAYAHGVKRDGAYRHVATPDFVLHEWALEPDQDRDDLELVKQANPGSWQTVEELRRRHDDPSTTPWQWGRFACGVWLAGEDGAISEKEWRACGDPEAEIPPGTKGVVIGVDLAFKWDTTAFVPLWKPDPEEPIIVGRPKILTPPRDGTSLPYEEVWQTAQELADRYPEARFILDPARDGEHLAQQIDGETDAEAIIYPQSNPGMTMAAQRLSEAIANGGLRHPEDPELTSHVLAAGAYWVGEKWKLVKQRRKNMSVDACVALAMGVSSMIADAPPDPETFRIELL